ncbi:hypothetical protein C499_12950 [Halogeometricum borinquense DSM 11551]|uniref:Uncharacterized protein n=1 Tax=Halogeometricum borinquense (strain ATCC 700274 / DSM 11551 / JCM 10706 / KCTC 4070 / PR3) TaxID=469382 RepID=L9UKF6_HALBP|nr:hypothetical protein C499_12950 [Halogeometricum borinquense DSM 11551]
MKLKRVILKRIFHRFMTPQSHGISVNGITTLVTSLKKLDQKTQRLYLGLKTIGRQLMRAERM